MVILTLDKSAKRLAEGFISTGRFLSYDSKHLSTRIRVEKRGFWHDGGYQASPLMYIYN